MPSSVRDYWWAAVVIPVALVISALLLSGLFTTETSGTAASARPAAVTSDPPAGTSTPTTPRADADATACAGNTVTRAVRVSISRQRMWMCLGPTTVQASAVTTGIDTKADRTPTGTWRILARETDRYLTGPDYRVFVRFWLPFFGDFGFHDSPWQRFPYGSADYRTGGSRGCVHVPGSVMPALYAWATVGTTVTIRA